MAAIIGDPIIAVTNTPVDSALSPTSENPVQNKKVKEALDLKSDLTNLAAAYSTSATYAVGDYCTRDGKLYRCNTAINTAEAWTAGHWTEVKVGTDLSNKVDKVSGKGLSKNDLTDALKTKLDEIEAHAEVNVQSDWNQSDNSKDDYIKNKPTIDDALSGSSTNAVQNKIVKAGIDGVQENLDALGFSVVSGALNQTAGTTTKPAIKDSTGKKIRDAIYSIAGIYDWTDYKSITRAVRNGDGSKIPNGTTFVVPHTVYGNIDFVVRRRNVDKVFNDSSRPTLTIQTKYLLSPNANSSASTFQYDRPEAFASVAEAIPANTVCKFTAPRTYNSWEQGVYHFTATAEIPVGSKLLFSGNQNNAFTAMTVQVYANAKATSSSASYAISSGDGDATVNLGTLESDLNHYYRILWGSNNAEQSNIHQFLNGTGVLADSWVAKTKFDMMCTSYSSLVGFYGGFPADFRDCLGLCSVHNLTNDDYEAPDSSTAKQNEYSYNAYFWLPSRKEVYGTNENTREASEAQFPYFGQIATTDADKLMYAKGASSPVSYWLRTPRAGYASYVRSCDTGSGGALGSSGASSSLGVAPLAILA